MAEETQTNFKTEGELAFPVVEKETDNSSDPSSVKEKETNTDSTQSQDGDQKSGEENKESGDNPEGKNNEKKKGLADHPRWKKREANWKKRYNDQEERHTNDIFKLREEFDGKIAGAGQSNQSRDNTLVKVPDWFGGDEKQWEAFQDWNKGLLKESQEGALKTIASQEEGNQKKIDEATKYFTDQVEELETDAEINPSGNKIDRNKLLKFVLDNDLVDSQGRWNYRAALIMMKTGVKSIKAKNTDDRKKLASMTNSENRAESKPSTIKTSEDFAKPGARPW